MTPSRTPSPTTCIEADNVDSNEHDMPTFTAHPATAKGLTVEQLAQATSRQPVELRFVLDDELRTARVVRDEDGRFTLIADAFDDATLRALAALAPPEVSDRPLLNPELRDETSGSRWEPAKRARTSESDSQHVPRVRSVSGTLRARQGAT